MVRQKISAILLAALVKSDIGDVTITQAGRQVVQLAYAVYIGNGFNIEYKTAQHENNNPAGSPHKNNMVVTIAQAMATSPAENSDPSYSITNYTIMQWLGSHT